MPAHKIVIDTDPGVDDVLAILLALASPEVDLALISIVFGNTHAPAAHANLLKIYHALAKEVAEAPEASGRYGRLGQKVKTVLALGEDGPIGGEKATAAYFHGMDGLSNISETHPHFTPEELGVGEVHEHLDISPKPAPVAMLDLLRNEPEGTVTIVAIGPLTNLAHAFRAEPETFARVHSVVWMGGALDVPGNTSPVAEFNCFADPYAASSIIDAAKSGLFTLVMAPLDITTPHTVPFDDLIHENYVPNPDGSFPSPSSDPPGPLKNFIGAMLVRVRGLQASFGLKDAMEMHDPVAVWYAIANAGKPITALSDGWVVKTREFKVERNGECTRGMCVVDRRGTGNEGEDRTEVDRLKNGKQAESADNKKEESVNDKEKINLPWIITDTPGSEVLRKMLMERVFGVQI